jgi:hypothetical protein
VFPLLPQDGVSLVGATIPSKSFRLRHNFRYFRCRTRRLVLPLPPLRRLFPIAAPACFSAFILPTSSAIAWSPALGNSRMISHT